MLLSMFYQSSTSNNGTYSYNTLNRSNSESFSYGLKADLEAHNKKSIKRSLTSANIYL